MGTNDTAVGPQAIANGNGAFAAGWGANAARQQCEVAIGTASIANGASATAIGSQASAIGQFATATGAFANANGQFATANGAHSIANGATASAFGEGAQALADKATAIGQGAIASQIGATAIGQGAIASGDPTTAVGMGAMALSNNASAFGAGAVAGIAPGSGDNATALGQVRIGDRRKFKRRSVRAPWRAAPIRRHWVPAHRPTASRIRPLSAPARSIRHRTKSCSAARVRLSSCRVSPLQRASLPRKAGPTAFVSTDAAGHLAASAYGPQDIATLYSGLSSLQQDMKHAYAGSAIAIALGGASLPAGKNFAISGNFGTYRGQSAFAAIAQARVNDNVIVNAGVGGGFEEGGVGGRVGLTLAW